VGSFLAGFTDELVKLSASRKNPYSSVQNHQDKLLRGNLSDYIGTEEIRHQPHPSMEEVSNRAFKDRTPKIDARPPKPPKT
jgi:hypothetical protein